jgi:hypothetical protein
MGIKWNWRIAKNTPLTRLPLLRSPWYLPTLKGVIIIIPSGTPGHEPWQGASGSLCHWYSPSSSAEQVCKAAMEYVDTTTNIQNHRIGNIDISLWQENVHQ